jgi:hypothetical protein
LWMSQGASVRAHGSRQLRLSYGLTTVIRRDLSLVSPSGWPPEAGDDAWCERPGTCWIHVGRVLM